MTAITFQLRSVKEACKTLPSRTLKATIPKDGRNARPIRMSYVGADPNPGQRATFGLPTKYKVYAETQKTADGEWIGKIQWSILGKYGFFPAVSDYLDKPVPASATPTFFPTEEQARECAETCADILRTQIASLVHQ